ncbi:hypothetical protein GEU84_018615 [Fertoebacter nigrum]|uniref:Uncharacterized protein n=1 Tax=Fertoeibacter niger TaxID=2656921 RepID=A0A8X8H4U5_9RHOB|nr:hypothetical protein [Fertoeibacter niger]NUB46409.1 hypothetical protein [Fertoeibacter niger]
MRICLACFAAVLITASAASAQMIGGSYTVEGANMNGSPYAGTAEIALTAENCEIFWTTGTTTSSGICMVGENVFVAGYELGGKVGLVIYRVLPDGVLDGSWTIAGQPGAGYEVLVPR